MPARTIGLRKRCPRCAGPGRAEAQLAGFAGTRPPEFDLDDLDRLAARHSLGILLALVELLPYKQFTCAGCGYQFRLANRDAKNLVLGMLSAMQPVPDDGTSALPAARPARPHRAKPARPSPPATPPTPVRAAKAGPAKRPPNRPASPPDLLPLAPDSAALPPPTFPDWEPEGLD
ncbi:MAG: hypothetical protein MUC79_12125 [Thiobacillaceae bacterium]|nr:hypothetical protein [Thiobacillaceae bacterium]